MKRQYDPEFIKALKKADVRIHKSFRKRISIFAKNPYDSILNNHKLKREHKGYRSIDITNDWRALYVEKTAGEETVAYFSAIGTHKQLYKQIPKIVRESILTSGVSPSIAQKS